MLQQLFGAELDFSVRLAVSLVVIAALLGITVFVMRRLGAGMPGRAAGRGRTGPRLSIVDAISLDPRRRLVLVRRDDVEHLLLTGGTNDVVVEQNINGGRAAAPARPAPPIEREAQRSVPSAAKAPLAAPRPDAAREKAQLPPAPQTEALAAAAPAAALTAPAAEPRMPPRMPEIQRRPAPVEPAAVERPLEPADTEGAAEEEYAAGRPPQRVIARAPAPEPRPAAEPAPAPAADKTPQERADELRLAADRRKSQAAALRQRLPALPDDQKREAAETIKRIDRRVAALLQEADRLVSGEAEPEPPVVQPRLSEDAAKRGLALLLGTGRPAVKGRETAEEPFNGAAPDVSEDEKTTARKAAAERAAAERAAAERAAAEKAAAERAATEKAAAERAAAEKAAAEKAAAEKAAAERAAAEKAAAERAAAEKAAAEKAAAERAAAEKAAAERAATEKAAAEKAAAERAAAEKAAAERAAAEKAAAEKAATEKAAAERAAAERAAAEKAAAEKAAAEKAAAERAAAEKAAAERAAAERAAENALADQIAAEMAEALEVSLQDRAAPAVAPAVEAPSHPALRPAARLDAAPEVRPHAAVEPQLREMAQRLDAALARPQDDSLRLSLSDLLEDIEGAAAEVNAPVAAPAERPRIVAAPRPAEATTPRVEPKARAGAASADYARFLSDETAAPATAPAETPARTKARELFSDGWLRATRRADHPEEPARKAPEVTALPSRSAEPVRVVREPVLSARPAEAGPLADVLPRMVPDATVTKPQAGTAEEKKAADDDAGFLDEFDAEMATLLGRTPSSR
ncbi:flagellar biosynthetic protein FliO [Xanthobacter sp. V2C-8]|uniref:flagellar biosynthetic protein FliO n=1 Tax=Xanthobacter albus TaxID=3119929 RepID=UPI003729AD7B